jgi:hypothetical protein
MKYAPEGVPGIVTGGGVTPVLARFSGALYRKQQATSGDAVSPLAC